MRIMNLKPNKKKTTDESSRPHHSPSAHVATTRPCQLVRWLLFPVMCKCEAKSPCLISNLCVTHRVITRCYNLGPHFTPKRLRAWRKEPSCWTKLRASFARLFIQLQFTLEVSALELERFMKLTMLTWHGSHVEWLGQALGSFSTSFSINILRFLNVEVIYKCREFEHLFCMSNPNDFPSMPCLVINSSIFV